MVWEPIRYISSTAWVPARNASTTPPASARTTSLREFITTLREKSTPAIRGQAQGFLVLVTYGVGMLIGAQVAGNIFNSFLGDAQALPLDLWKSFWFVPAGLAAAIALFFALTFYEKEDFRDQIKEGDVL